MKEKRFLLFCFFVLQLAFSQIKGIVKDSISGKPIPYATISIENENLGTTSEENGTFTINEADRNKNLIFSVLGYNKKIVNAAKAIEVKLKPVAILLNEIFIPTTRQETKKTEIGDTDNVIFKAFDNGPKIDTKFFPYLPSYKKTRYLKNIIIDTDSRIENATFKIHFYAVNANGSPAEELLEKNYIVTVKNGTRKTSFDLTDFYLEMPKTGLFVGFEKLIIEKNKLEKTTIDRITNKPILQKIYYPFVMYNFVERPFSFSYSGGKWLKQTKSIDASGKMMIYEPAINLLLTN
jgi:hypothetical protein